MSVWMDPSLTLSLSSLSLWDAFKGGWIGFQGVRDKRMQRSNVAVMWSAAQCSTCLLTTSIGDAQTTNPPPFDGNKGIVTRSVKQRFKQKGATEREREHLGFLLWEEHWGIIRSLSFGSCYCKMLGVQLAWSWVYCVGVLLLSSHSSVSRRFPVWSEPPMENNSVNYLVETWQY